MKWEMFLDHAYYDMYAVRPVGDKDFNSRRLFHFALKTEAERLLNYLNSVDILELQSCEHKSDDLVYCSNPPQNKCVNCKEFYR